MEEEYCKRVIQGDASMIVLYGWLEEYVCADFNCPDLGSEYDIIEGIDGVKRRFCQTKGLLIEVIKPENQLSI